MKKKVLIGFVCLLATIILAVPKMVTGDPGADQIKQQKEFVEAYDQYVRALLIGEKVSYVGKGKMEVITNLWDFECTNSLLMTDQIEQVWESRQLEP